MTRRRGVVVKVESMFLPGEPTRHLAWVKLDSYYEIIPTPQTWEEIAAGEVILPSFQTRVVPSDVVKLPSEGYTPKVGARVSVDADFDAMKRG